MQNSIYNIHDPVGIKHLTRLRLGLSHLKEQKFRHNFQDCLNPLCSCSLEVQTTNHYFLRCHYYNHIRRTILDTVKEITNICLSDFSDKTLVGPVDFFKSYILMSFILDLSIYPPLP